MDSTLNDQSGYNFSSDLSGVDVDVGDDQVDHGQAEHGAGEGHAVHQGVGYLNVNIYTIIHIPYMSLVRRIVIRHI